MRPRRNAIMDTQDLKQELLVKITRLSEHRLRETLDFVSFLLYQDRYGLAGYQDQEQGLDLEQDPLLQFIGRVSYGSLAQGIDEELYGI
jgi:hypothetical protein